MKPVVKLSVLALVASRARAVSKSSGCGTATTKTIGSTYSDSFKAGGVDRTFTVFVPEDYDDNTPMPLVSLRGGGRGDRRTHLLTHLTGLFHPRLGRNLAGGLLRLRHDRRGEKHQWVHRRSPPGHAGLPFRQPIQLGRELGRRRHHRCPPLSTPSHSRPQSWHFNASCQNGGTSCDTSKKTDQYCYESNSDCQDCDWTSCYDDVAFIDELYVGGGGLGGELDHRQPQPATLLPRTMIRR